MEATGYSNYHSLQVEMRQQAWHGLQYNLNYTWAHTLGYQVNTNGSSAGGYGCAYYGYAGWCGWPGTLTLRNRRLAYGPAQYDIRHAAHLSGTYDLPIGPGKLLLSQNNLASRILGDWNSLGSRHRLRRRQLPGGGSLTSAFIPHPPRVPETFLPDEGESEPVPASGTNPVRHPGQLSPGRPELLHQLG